MATEWFQSVLTWFLFSCVDHPVGSTYDSEKLTCDEHCYECKVRFRDPKPKDLMMFLHAWRYKVLFSATEFDVISNQSILVLKGPGWSYETQLPAWAQAEWENEEF